MENHKQYDKANKGVKNSFFMKNNSQIKVRSEILFEKERKINGIFEGNLS